MNVLIPCSHCERHVRSHEPHCPFCKGTLEPAVAPPLARAQVPGASRAAAFALRTALVVAPAALACGEGSAERQPDEVASSAGSGSVAGAAGAPATGGAGGSTSAEDTKADAGAADAGFVPVPIYGGVFPDPLTRARV